MVSEATVPTRHSTGVEVSASAYRHRSRSAAPPFQSLMSRVTVCPAASWTR